MPRSSAIKTGTILKRNKTGPVRKRGVFPATFNPPTTAHLAIAEAAWRQHNLDEVHLVLSERPLDKDSVTRPTLDERVAVTRASVAQHRWAEVSVTSHQLLADIAADFDVLIMGADKWEQLHELRYYQSTDHMQMALASLPTLAIAPRAGSLVDIPAEVLLTLPADMTTISSTAARAGAVDLMTPAARAWADANGGWPQ